MSRILWWPLELKKKAHSSSFSLLYNIDNHISVSASCFALCSEEMTTAKQGKKQCFTSTSWHIKPGVGYNLA